jgi:hypothetical protein
MDDSQLKIGEPDKNQHPNIDLHYYYSREKRLENASRRIQDMYKPDSGKRGFLRSLTDTPPKLMLFATIIVLCVVIVVLTRVVN